MSYFQFLHKLLIKLSIVSLYIVSIQTVSAQSGTLTPNVDVQVRVTVASKVLDAEVLNLQTFGVDIAAGSTTEPLFWVELHNTTSKDIDNLRINIKIESTKDGLLLSAAQTNSGFILPAGAKVSGSSTTLVDQGFPGIRGEIRFDAYTDVQDVMTSKGKQFYNKLTGDIPNDVYKITLFLTRNGETVASNVQFLGVKPLEAAQTVDFFLIQPGAEVGSNQTIMTINPNFRWDGPRTGKYRLVVVNKAKNSDESAEGLIQNALSSKPTLRDGRSIGGSLIDNEIVDAIVNGVDFTLPPQGVQKLVEGELYYWQIFYIATVKGVEELNPSTIWEFTVARPGENTATNEIEESLYLVLNGLIDEGLVNELKENGFKLMSVEYNNKTVRGSAMLIREIEVIKENFMTGKYKF
jgi:hypothetical protein